MFFKKEKIKCEKCKSAISEDYSYCPYCGNPMIDAERKRKEFGILGNTDAIDEEEVSNSISNSNLGFMDKLIDSAMNSIMRSMEKEMKKSMSNLSPSDMQAIPNGIKIRLAPSIPQKRQSNKNQKIISEGQIQRMSKMPKATAKTNVRRLTDKVVYELSIPGISNPEDVFISKLEQGYEIRAIGSKKVYINSLPVELPIKGFAYDKEKLIVEFKTSE